MVVSNAFGRNFRGQMPKNEDICLEGVDRFMSQNKTSNAGTDVPGTNPSMTENNLTRAFVEPLLVPTPKWVVKLSKNHQRKVSSVVNSLR